MTKMTQRILIQVILPLKLDWEPFYWAEESLERGDRIGVTFSNRKYVAVVDKVDVTTGLDCGKIRSVDDYSPGLPPISERELDFWRFVADYYLCTIGEVYLAAYPHTKIRSEQVAARAVENAARRRQIELEALEKRLERLQERLSAKEALIQSRLSGGRAKSEAVTQRLQEERMRIADEFAVMEERVAKAREAVEAGEAGEDIPALQNSCNTPSKPLLLSAADRVPEYKKAIAQTLGEGRDVLVLTPDNLNCKKLECGLREEFPELMTVNSTISQVRRRKVSDAVRQGGGNVVLGTRLAVFLPFRDLGLIIVDNEQDPYFKQTDIAPRYNARDCAMKLALIHGARVMLGSSAPSLETVLNARSGKYATMAADGQSCASVEIVDLIAERGKRGVKGYYSYKLIEAVRSVTGRVVLIRGWERPEELLQQTAELFPGREVEIMRYPEAREAELESADLVAVLQADALVDNDDFRADERGAQIIAQLASRCRRLVVQTAVAARFDGSRSIDDLLKERKDFGFPPYTRLVEYRLRSDATPVGRFFLKRDASLSEMKRRIAADVPEGSYIDVDPI